MDEAEIRSKYEAGLLAKVSRRLPSPLFHSARPGSIPPPYCRIGHPARDARNARTIVRYEARPLTWLCFHSSASTSSRFVRFPPM